jgi:hypothetical protein
MRPAWSACRDAEMRNEAPAHRLAFAGCDRVPTCAGAGFVTATMCFRPELPGTSNSIIPLLRRAARRCPLGFGLSPVPARCVIGPLADCKQFLEHSTRIPRDAATGSASTTTPGDALRWGMADRVAISIAATVSAHGSGSERHPQPYSQTTRRSKPSSSGGWLAARSRMSAP